MTTNEPRRARYGLLRSDHYGALMSLYDIVDHGDGGKADDTLAKGLLYAGAKRIVDALNFQEESITKLVDKVIALDKGD